LSPVQGGQTNTFDTAPTSSGLGESDEIDLGVGIGIGIPALIATVAGSYFGLRMWMKAKSAN